MTTTYYPDLLATRIFKDLDRSDQSGSDDGAVVDWVKSLKFGVATLIGYNGKDTAASSYRLRWRNDTDNPGGSFADIGTTGELKYTSSSDSVVDENGVTEGERICDDPGGMTWQDGLENAGDNLLPDSGTFDLGSDCYSEFHWGGLSLIDGDPGDQYSIQLYNATEGAGYTCGATIRLESTSSSFEFIAEANGSNDGSGTSISTGTTLNVAAGDVLVATGRYDGSIAGSEAIGDGGSNNLTVTATNNGGSGGHTQAFGYLLVAVANSSATFTFSYGASRSYRRIRILQFRPASGKNVSIAGGPNPATGSSTTPTSGAISYSGDDMVAVGGSSRYDGWNASTNHQFEGIDADGAYADDGFLNEMWYKFYFTNQTDINATCSANNYAWIADIIAIKAAAGAIQRDVAGALGFTGQPLVRKFSGKRLEEGSI